MKLQEIAARDAAVGLRALDQDLALAGEIQARLIKLGCLDPPVDGDFGPVSTLVLREFAKRVGGTVDDSITPQIARALLDHSEDTLLPVSLGIDFPSRIVKYMQLRNFWFAKLPGFLNIVYVEGVNKDGGVNANEFNKFTDRRIVIAIENGKPNIRLNVLATTEPGRFYTENPLPEVRTKGVARIAFGQYKAWRVGTHNPGAKTAHEALVQVGEITVYRDLNKDGVRAGDKIDVGSGFAINQHSGWDAPINDIGKASAGCLVGRSHAEHREFMKLVKTDPRYKRATMGYRYITTIISGEALKDKIG